MTEDFSINDVKNFMDTTMTEKGYTCTDNNSEAEVTVGLYFSDDSKWITVMSDTFMFNGPDDAKKTAVTFSDKFNTYVIAAACVDSDYLMRNFTLYHLKMRNLLTKKNLVKEDVSLENEVFNTSEKHKDNFYRDDIEEIIKEKQIDRNRFHEFSKINYVDILKKFFFSFSNIKNFPTNPRPLAINRMHFRSDLKKEAIDCILRTDNWCEYMSTIKSAITDNEKKLFLILSDGWVYEGEIKEMFIVLNEMWNINDFYIVSSKFNWFIPVSRIEENAVMYSR